MDEFAHTGLFTAADQAVLASYCQLYARWRQAEEQVAREGQTIQEPIVTRSGNISGYRLKKHPAVTNAKDANVAMVAAGRLLGLNPSSRAQIHLPDPDQAESSDEEDDGDLYVN